MTGSAYIIFHFITDLYIKHCFFQSQLREILSFNSDSFSFTPPPLEDELLSPNPPPPPPAPLPLSPSKPVVPDSIFENPVFCVPVPGASKFAPAESGAGSLREKPEIVSFGLEVKFPLPLPSPLPPVRSKPDVPCPVLLPEKPVVPSPAPGAEKLRAI